MREGKAQSQMGGKRAAVIRRTEYPHFWAVVALGLHVNAGEGMIVRQASVEIANHFINLLRKLFGIVVLPVAHGLRREPITARRAAHAEIDAAREQRAQHAKLLGDFERVVVRQHDATGADTNLFGHAGNTGEQNLRARISQAQQAVMFRQPITMITKAIRRLGEFQCRLQRFGRCAVAGDGRLIEDGKAWQGHRERQKVRRKTRFVILSAAKNLLLQALRRAEESRFFAALRMTNILRKVDCFT